ncbi:GNAT family N-acetyltransferase [Shewanella sp.]|nr:GNAT family N-acetyltransferase [Shewanella sp.]
MMEHVKIRLATAQDVAALAQLEQSQLHDELTLEQRNNSFSGQSFTQADLTELVTKHWVAVAQLNHEIIGYVIAGRWSFFKQWPIYRHLLHCLPSIDYDKAALTDKNCCQYGPIWIASAHRGQGLFEALVECIKQAVAKELPYMLTFIAEDNQGSFAAHTRKAAMQVVDFISFDDRDYYLMVVSTSTNSSL